MLKTETLENIFTKLAKNNLLSHAYLFHGPPCSEKENFAFYLANFLEYGDFKSADKPLLDVKIISPAKDKKTIGIDEIREIRNFLSLHPLQSKKRAVIINPAESLSWQAAPALLKIVEEPPSNSLIIFIAHDAQVLIPALLSRVTKVFFGGVNVQKPVTKPDDSLASSVENTIIKLYLADPIKNSKKISLLLEKEEAAKRYNLNEKIQKKALEILTY